MQYFKFKYPQSGVSIIRLHSKIRLRSPYSDKLHHPTLIYLGKEWDYQGPPTYPMAHKLIHKQLQHRNLQVCTANTKCKTLHAA